MPRQKDTVRPSNATTRGRRKAAPVRKRHSATARTYAGLPALIDGPADDDDLEMLQARFVEARIA